MKWLRNIFQSEYKSEQVPLHRAYGVWRKQHPVVDRAVFYLLRIVVLFVLGVLGVAAFSAIFSLLLYADLLVATVFMLTVISIIAIIFTKAPRKRHKLMRKIKKLCKAERYRIKMCRPFLNSFRWSSAEPDFILETGRYVYYGHFLTVAKYNSTLTFKNAESIERVSYPLDNKFTVIFEFKPIRKELKTDFKPLPESDTKRYIRAVIVNPVCKEMYECDRDGELLATGNGMEKFGYTVYTGSGFIESVKRNETLKKQNMTY